MFNLFKTSNTTVIKDKIGDKKMTNPGDRSFKEITYDIISEFVTYPEDLSIEERAGKSSVIIGISSPHRDDISQVIGKQGANITAFKKLIEIIANKRELRCTVYVVD